MPPLREASPALGELYRPYLIFWTKWLRWCARPDSLAHSRVGALQATQPRSSKFPRLQTSALQQQKLQSRCR